MSKTLELLGNIKNKKIPTRSELNLRNKSKQVKVKNSNLPYITKEKDKCSKILFPTELVMSFNPLTMEEDEFYNRQNEFRTEKSFSSTALALKAHYESNPEIKAKFEEYANVSEKLKDKSGVSQKWDTSDIETFTLQDMKVFDEFRELRLFTNDMVKINLPTLTKKAFPCNYLANYTRDEFGSVVTEDGEFPEILRIQQFYRAIALEEHNEWEKANTSKTDKDKKDHYLSAMSSCPIQPDVPVNTALAVEVLVNNEWEPTKSLKTYTPDELKKALVKVNASKVIRETLESILDKFKRSDLNPDFLEIDMIVGDEDDKMERGKNTKYQLATQSLTKLVDSDGNSLEEDFKVLENSFVEVMDGFENLDGMMKKATTFNIIDDALVQSVYASLDIDKPFDSIERFITKEIADKYGDIISHVYQGASDEILVNSKLGQVKSGTVTDDALAIANESIRDILKGQEEIGSFDDEVEF